MHVLSKILVPGAKRLSQLHLLCAGYREALDQGIYLNPLHP